MKKTLLSSLLLISLVFTGCTSSGVSKNCIELTQGIKKSDLSAVETVASEYKEINPKEEITEFSLQILRKSFEDTNLLISPLSIISALGMTTNGAEGETLSQMEVAFGTDISALNDYLKAYIQSLPSSEKYKVNIADSIWINDTESLTVKADFLRKCKDYYAASVFKAPFDATTKDDINAWISQETDGMIDKMLEEPPSKETVMYLVNALSFDGEWQEIYKDTQVHEGEFTTSEGAKQKVEFMYSSEGEYLEVENGTGFIKPYKDNKYAFVALLPHENVTMEDFLENLSGETLMNVLAESKSQEVNVQIPKFSTQYEILLNDVLKEIGITDAFDQSRANFSALGKSEEGNIYIDKVLHKTKIEVQEKGTKAGAATVVEMKAECAIEEPPKSVILDRPFFYMIIDTQQNLPIFMGSLMDVEK